MGIAQTTSGIFSSEEVFAFTVERMEGVEVCVAGIGEGSVEGGEMRDVGTSEVGEKVL